MRLRNFGRKIEKFSGSVPCGPFALAAKRSAEYCGPYLLPITKQMIFALRYFVLFISGSIFLFGACVEANWWIRHTRHWILSEWPNVPSGPWNHHHRTQQVIDDKLEIRDMRSGFNFDGFDLYWVDAVFKLKDKDAALNLSKSSPEHVMNHFGRPYPTLGRSVHLISLGRFIVRRDICVLPLSAGYYWESTTTVTTVRIPAYIMLLLGGGPVGYALLNCVKRRIKSRQMLVRGFEIKP